MKYLKVGDKEALKILQKKLPKELIDAVREVRNYNIKLQNQNIKKVFEKLKKNINVTLMYEYNWQEYIIEQLFFDVVDDYQGKIGKKIDKLFSNYTKIDDSIKKTLDEKNQELDKSKEKLDIILQDYRINLLNSLENLLRVPLNKEIITQIEDYMKNEMYGQFCKNISRRSPFNSNDINMQIKRIVYSAYENLYQVCATTNENIANHSIQKLREVVNFAIEECLEVI